MRRGVEKAMAVALFCAFLAPLPAPGQSGQTADSPIKTWIRQIKKNPRDLAALKGLGEACFKTKRYDIARQCFDRALKIKPGDAQSLFFLGQVAEAKGKAADALKWYGRFSDAEAGPFRDRMEERYLVLKRGNARVEAQALMESENAIGSQGLLPDAVPVLPFATPDGDPAMAPVGKGLAEMLITDLSQIKRLTLVERIRVQSLFDEMELGQTGLVKESEAARFGKMLSAGRVVRGAVSGDMNSRIRMEASALNALRGEAGNPVAVSDAFKNLFRAEKDMAFKMLARMGIEPTPQEKQRILKIPTQNLQAFIAYCNGLDLEDKGEFQKAAAQYRKAVELDPQYKTAQQKLRVNQILARVGEAGFRKAGFRPSPDGAPQFDREALIENRLQTVQSNIGSNFIMGKDTRKPVQEVAEATDYQPPAGGDLPGPPPLPTHLP